MRIFAVLAATALVALAGCGGSDSHDSTASTATTAARGYADESAAVTAVMNDYFAALSGGDGAVVCGFFTDDAKAKIEAAGASCADAVTAGVKKTGSDAYQQPTIGTPKVTGSTATVHYSLSVKGQKVEGDQNLTKVGSDWKLEAATPPGG
jgi:ketosteroid isomerase-like protein